FNLRQFDSAGLGVVVGFESAPGDFGVESLEANAKAGGFGVAHAVVLCGGEGGEAAERLGIGWNLRFLIFPSFASYGGQGDLRFGNYLMRVLDTRIVLTRVAR